MKVIFLGNIGSGKSTLMAHLKQGLEEYSMHQVDEYRKIYSDSTTQGEEYAVQLFLSSIPLHSQPISKVYFIELTGFGKVGNELLARLRNDEDNKLIFYLSVSLSILKKRLEKDKLQKELTPFPGGAENLSASLEAIYRESILSHTKEKWCELPRTSFFQIENDTDLQSAENKDILLKIFTGITKR